jgi:hypothetical protein
MGWAKEQELSKLLTDFKWYQNFASKLMHVLM